MGHPPNMRGPRDGWFQRGSITLEWATQIATVQLSERFKMSKDNGVGIGGDFWDQNHTQERHHTMAYSTRRLPHHEVQDQTKWTYSLPDVESAGIQWQVGRVL